MKKVLFLMLFLVGLGAVNMSAQVRIGSDEAPNEAAVLDLNTDDLISDGAKGLALPRVSLATNDDKMGYSDLLEGMLVYNTNISMTGGVGVYYWDGNEWVKPAGIYEGSTSITLSGNSILRAALTGDVTAAENSNSTSISNGAVSRAKTTVRLSQLSATLPAAAGSIGAVTLPSGCSISNTIYNWNNQGSAVCGPGDTSKINCVRLFTQAAASTIYVNYLCFP